MGTIICENRNRIVELENNDERTQEHVGIMAAIALVALSMMLIAIKASFFATLSLTEQIIFIGSLILLFLSLIWSLKKEKKESDIKALLSVGLILIVPILI